jgi:3'(2'), 5'-bisphosphate nucleotidase
MTVDKAAQEGGGELDAEHRLAEKLAAEAGRGLMALRSRSSGGKQLGKQGDRWSNRLLLRRLAEHAPDDTVRSEEAEQGEPVGGAGRLWIVDPLDGTREFSEGREDWAVHVALALDGVAVVGAVALPALDTVLSTTDPHQLAEPATPPRMVVSRTRPPAFVPEVAERLGAETVEMGSAGAKIAAVIRGEAEIYVHAGGQYEWDSCAPVAVALAAGLHASRLDGSPLRYGQPEPWLPDLLVCHPSLTSEVTGALGAAGAVGTE